MRGQEGHTQIISLHVRVDVQQNYFAARELGEAQLLDHLLG